MSTPKIRQILCKAGRVYKRDDDGIVVVEVTNSDVFELDHYKEMVEAIGMIGNYRKQFVFIKMHPKILPSVEARNYLTQPESGKYTMARALLISSLAQRIIGNFIINVQKPDPPVRLFNTEKDAIKWLRSLRQAEVA